VVSRVICFAIAICPWGYRYSQDYVLASSMRGWIPANLDF